MFAPPDPPETFDKYDEPRLHMECLLKEKLVEFDIPLRILLPLEAAGIITLGDLSKHSYETLKEIRNIGKTRAAFLQEFLDYHLPDKK